MEHQLWCSRTSMLKTEATAAGKLGSEKPPQQDLQCRQKPRGELEQSSHLARMPTLQPGIQATFIVSRDTCTSRTMSPAATISHADTLSSPKSMPSTGSTSQPMPLTPPHSSLLPLDMTCTALAPELTGTANQTWLRNMVSPPGG